MLQRLPNLGIFLILILLVSSFVPGVAEANEAPTTVGTIPAQTVEVSGTAATVDVSSYFSDPDGDTLTYTVSSSDTAIATVSVSSATVTISAVAAGTATITVTATDPDAATAAQTISVTVNPANRAPAAVGTVPAQTVKVGGTAATVDVSSYFSDADGDTLTYTVSSSDTAIATVSVSSATVTISAVAAGTATITVTATDPDAATAEQTISVTVNPANRAPTTTRSISDITMPVGTSGTIDLSLDFSDPDGDTLTYAVTSSNTAAVTASVSGSDLTIAAVGVGTATLTGTATDPGGLSATLSVNFTITAAVSTADAIPGLSSKEWSILARLLTYDTLIFNELHNGSDDTTDWLELRNVRGADLALDSWHLTLRTRHGDSVVPFPAGTVLPADGVVLLTNTVLATADASGAVSGAVLVAETFVLPQTGFALILSSPAGIGDLTGNYVEGEGPETTPATLETLWYQTQTDDVEDVDAGPQTTPALTIDTVWERTQPIVFGYRAEAWTESTYQDGLGTPGYRHPAASADLNSDGVVNILDLVLVASQFGTTHATADLNADGTVDMDDLVFVANAWGRVAGAPTAGTVNTWLQLARQNVSEGVTTSTPEGFPYARGLQTLEHLARALTPETTALLANYPNPFNPETWIPYQLAKAADVTVSIHAADGNLVRTLVLGHQDAGLYKHRTQAAYWDGKNELGETVASGLYFYTLTAGDFTATRRMLILK